MVPDISQIGEFVYTWDCDKEDYEEYIQDNELENNNEQHSYWSSDRNSCSYRNIT